MFNYSAAIFSWFQDDARPLLYKHDLNADSIVVDVGAYTGIWTLKMYNKYNCTILAYEPVNEYYLKLKKDSSQFEKVKPYNFGLGSKNEMIKIEHRGVQTTVINKVENYDEIIEIKDISEVAQLNNISIDLISINIEGNEYELLKRIIDTKMINNIINLQVQFHEWYPSIKESKILRNQIHTKLNKTHKLVFCYDFVWEKWIKRV